MQRRKFVIGAGALASGAAAAVGTGAFDLTRVNRDFEVDVVGDDEAYLRLAPHEDTEYAELDGNKLALDFAGGLEQNGEGLNEDADQVFENVFEITNQGTQEVPIRLVDDPEGISQWDPELPAFYWSDTENPNYDEDHDFGESPVVNPGETIYVSIIFWGLAASNPAGRYEETDLDAAQEQDIIGIYADASDA